MLGLGPKDSGKLMKKEIQNFRLLGGMMQKIGPDGSFILGLSFQCQHG
jgi:hypothetical protein